MTVALVGGGALRRSLLAGVGVAKPRRPTADPAVAPVEPFGDGA
jgi:hypothetical protein